MGEGTEENLKAFGLDRPQAEIEIHMAAGATGQITEGGAYDVREWEENSAFFLIGQTRNEMTDYCLYDGHVYTINHFTLTALTETDPMDTLARYPVTVPLTSLSRMTVEEAGRRDELHLPAHLPDTRQRSRATPACSSA